jgi:hypothetical protein
LSILPSRSSHTVGVMRDAKQRPISQDSPRPADELFASVDKPGYPLPAPRAHAIMAHRAWLRSVGRRANPGGDGGPQRRPSAPKDYFPLPFPAAMELGPAAAELGPPPFCQPWEFVLVQPGGVAQSRCGGPSDNPGGKSDPHFVSGMSAKPGGSF